MARLEKSYPSVKTSESQFLTDLRELLETQELDPTEQHRFMIVVSEAFTNALIHGNRWDPDKRVSVILDVNSDRLLADIIDQGEGSPDRIDSRPPPSLTSEGGRGIDLIKHFATDVRIERSGDEGLRVSITLDRVDSTNNQRV